MTRYEIAQVAARKTGLSPQKCDEAIEHVMNAIVKASITKGEGVMIEKFGRFAVRRSGFGRYLDFVPAKELVDIAGTITPAPKPVPVKLRPERAEVRPEDAAIIEQWLADRRGRAIPNVTANVLYDDSPDRPSHYLADQTIETARKSLLVFARSVSVPLLHVGLSSSKSGLYELDALRAEIVAYAQRYQARVLPRLMEKLQKQPGQERLVVPHVFRTMGWTKFVRYSRDFYNWTIEQGLRPLGSNPLTGIKYRNPTVADKKVIVRSWYRQVLNYPMSPRDRALIYIIANGCRASEAGSVQLKNLSLTSRKLTVIQKGGQSRILMLNPWTVTAIDAYLQTRWDDAHPALFHGRKIGKPMTRAYVDRIVKRLAAKVFPQPDQKRQRERIYPHGFRHFFATTALDNGMSPQVVMHQMGHKSLAMLSRYTTIDDEILKKEHRRATKKRWW